MATCPGHSKLDVATTLNGGDYSACSTWLCSGPKACLVDIYRAQVEFPTLKDRIRTMDKLWKPNLIIIEKDGIGKSLVQELQKSGMKHVQPIKAPADKIGRLQLSSLRFGDGLVFIKPGIAGLNDLRTEWNAFPEGKFDDQVDCITVFLSKYDRCVEFVRRQPNLRLQQSSGNLVVTVKNIEYPTRMPDLW
jgi:predicted phage terminase large subunit-like protein